MKRTIMFMALAIIAFMWANVGCDIDTEPTADEEQSRATQALTAEAQAQIGMPAISNFQERKLAKMLYELRDQEDLLCYCYIWSSFLGKYTFVGECIGYGIPASVQFSNPERIAWSSHQGGATTLPQPEPNGLFMPEGLMATYVMLLDSVGDIHPTYMEDPVTISPTPFPARIVVQDNI